MSRLEVRQLVESRSTAASRQSWAPRASDRVIAGWLNDPDFLLPNGQPRPLTYSGADQGFQKLTRKYSGGIPPRAMLNELLDARCIRDLGAGSFVPEHPQPSQSHTLQESYLAFGAKLNALGSTLARNLQSSDPAPLFDKFVVVDGISEEQLAKTTRDLNRRCRTFSDGIEQYLLDQCAPPQSGVFGQRPHSLGVIVAMVQRGTPVNADDPAKD